MSGARVFISYKRDDPATAPVREAVAQALKDAGHEPLVDRDILRPGDAWRARLAEHLLDCHGAVVLVSELAAGSEWVRHEVSVLMARKVRDPRFVLVPVLIGVKPEVLARGGWEPTGLSAIQGCLVADDVATAAQAVKAAFAPLAPSQTPREKFRDRVVLTLGVTDEAARRVLQVVGGPPGGAATLADWLLEDVANRLPDVIHALETAHVDRDTRLSIWEALWPLSWIHEAPAARVAAAMVAAVPDQAFVLNARTPYAAQSLRRRTLLYTDSETEGVSVAYDPTSPDPVAELRARANAELMDRHQAESAEEWARIQRRRRPSEPRWVVDVQLPDPDPALLAELRSAEPRVWFLLRGGPADPDPVADAVPDPGVDGTAEDDALADRKRYIPGPRTR